jgi:hypothetical protein
MDWKLQTMQVWVEGQMVKLQGQGVKQEQQSFLNTFL